MPVMRVNKNRNYTTMSNVHLRDLNLSLKARGLLSTILSLPDNWNYSISGLASICKENETCIKSGLNELKKAGYMVVEKLYSDESGTGKFKYIYNIFENPEDSEELRNEIAKKEKRRASRGANPPVESPQVEPHPLNKYTDILNTDILNKEELNTDKDNKASTKVEVQYNKVTKPCNVTIPYNYTQEQFEVFIESKVQKLINQISQGEGSDSIKKISDIISYFYKKYYEVIGERHPLLSDVAYTGIIAKLLEPIDIIQESGYRLDSETYEALIDRFFMTDYGERSGNYTDYRIGYFFSDRVLENLYYRELY